MTTAGAACYVRPMKSFDGFMVSYAQCGEDVVLRRVFGDRPTGFFIDIGANDPVVDSVTKYFSLLGWRGVNVEPLSALHERLVADRPNDINLRAAVSDHEGTIDIMEPVDNHLLATANSSIADIYKSEGRAVTTQSVPSISLAKLCETHVKGQRIDFLKLDVEGHEETVLRSGNWQRFRPRVLIIEAYCGGKHSDYPFMVSQYGYIEAFFDGLNRWYVRKEDEAELKHFFRYPANTFDKYIRFEHANAISQRPVISKESLEFAEQEREFIALGKEWKSLGGAIQTVARKLANLKDASPVLKRIVKAAVSDDR